MIQNKQKYIIQGKNTDGFTDSFFFMCVEPIGMRNLTGITADRNKAGKFVSEKSALKFMDE